MRKLKLQMLQPQQGKQQQDMVQLPLVLMPI
jgi:hypothetical protein